MKLEEEINFYIETAGHEGIGVIEYLKEIMTKEELRKLLIYKERRYD